MTIKQRLNLGAAIVFTVIWLAAAGIGLSRSGQLLEQPGQPVMIACSTGNGSGNSCGG